MAVNLLSLDVADAATRNRIVDALCAVNGYQAQVPDPVNPGQVIPNPVTKAAFAKEHVKAYLKATVLSYERSQAATSAAPDLT